MNARGTMKNLGACVSVQKHNDNDRGVHLRIKWRSKNVQVSGLTDEERRKLIEDIRNF